MITICPQCQLSLAVSAADLRVAQGHVRCGRCASVFNALVSLYDNEAEALAPQAVAAPGIAAGSATEAAAATEATQSRMVAVTLDADAARDDIVPQERLDAAADTRRVEWPPAANDPGIEEVVAANDPIADAEALGIRAPAIEGIERLDIDLGALPSTVDPWQVMPHRQPAGVESVDLAEPEPHAPEGSDGDLIPIYDLDAEREVAAEPADPIEPPLDELAPAAEARGHARLWAAGSLVLALLLAGQWIHHQREALVGWPALSGPLTRLYAAIGQPIHLRGDLNAYDVRQLGAVAGADAAGTLTVRASLRNLSPRPQPMPLLRVTLQDRYGNRIASRDLTAAEYQQRRAGTPPMTLLAAGARLETAVQLVDPGGNAVGFELDVCLAEDGTTRCASDLATATAR